MNPSRNLGLAITLLISTALLGLSSEAGGQEIDSVDLNVLMYPYVPEGSAGIEKFEEHFEAFCKKKGISVDLDLTLKDTYGNASGALNFDIAEIDLCMIDTLESGGKLPLADLSSFLPQGERIGPAKSVAKHTWANKVVPHWVCGNFLVFQQTDTQLKNAKSFDEITALLEPIKGKSLFADLWGGGTLGELYADAVLDIYGKEYATKHLKQLASVEVDIEPEKESKEQEFVRWSAVVNSLDAAAVLKMYRLSEELETKLKANRKAVHNTPYIVPRLFADETASVLLGYSERMYHIERDIQDEPWDGDSFPVDKDKYSVRQFPFHNNSQGTPTWCDAFVVPEREDATKSKAIKLFFEFALSQQGYEILLEPREYYPAAYLLPAYLSVTESDFCKEKMPLIEEYVQVVDDSFPVFEHDIYSGLDKAGEALKLLLKHVN